MSVSGLDLQVLRLCFGWTRELWDYLYNSDVTVSF